MHYPSRVITVSSLLALFTFLPALAQDDDPSEKKYGWFNSTEFSLVQTDGNTEGGTFSFRNDLSRVWENAVFALEAGGLQAKSTVFSRFATGTPDNYTVIENKKTDTTAKKYFLRGRYDHQISDSLFWFAGLGWERNQFAGFDDRYQAVGGLGNIWFEGDDAHFRTYYGVTWTSQNDVIENRSIDEEFLGLQLGWDYGRQLTGNTVYANLLKVDANVDESDDWRTDMTNSLAVSMTERLALKLSLQLLYDNMPSLVAVDLLDENGQPSGATVLAELDELDSILTAALVISF